MMSLQSWCTFMFLLLRIVSECVATEDSSTKMKEKEPIPDLNQSPPPEEMKESVTTTKDANDLLPDEEWIEIWRKNHKKEVRRQQRIRCNMKLNKDPNRKAALRVKRNETEKAGRLRRKQALTPEKRKAVNDRKKLLNVESAKRRKITHYGGFSTRREQERNNLITMEKSGKLDSSDAQKLQLFREIDRKKYQRRAQRKKDLGKIESNGSNPERTKE